MKRAFNADNVNPKVLGLAYTSTIIQNSVIHLISQASHLQNHQRDTEPMPTSPTSLRPIGRPRISAITIARATSLRLSSLICNRDKPVWVDGAMRFCRLSTLRPSRPPPRLVPHTAEDISCPCLAVMVKAERLEWLEDLGDVWDMDCRSDVCTCCAG